MYNVALSFLVTAEPAKKQPNSNRSPLLQPSPSTPTYSSVEETKDLLVEQVNSLLSHRYEDSAIKVVQKALDIMPQKTPQDREKIRGSLEKVKSLFIDYYANYYGLMSYETAWGKPGVIKIIEDALLELSHPASSQAEIKDDNLFTRVQKLINQNNLSGAIELTKTVLSEIKEKKDESLNTVQNYQEMIGLLGKVKALIAQQFEWFGFNMGKHPVLSDIHKTIVSLQEELEKLQAPAQTTHTASTYQQAGR